jgi:hypothetical protein
LTGDRRQATGDETRDVVTVKAVTAVTAVTAVNTVNTVNTVTTYSGTCIHVQTVIMTTVDSDGGSDDGRRRPNHNDTHAMQ